MGTLYFDDTGNGAAHSHLPSRRERLRAYIALKRQKAVLSASLVVLLLLCAFLAFTTIRAESQPDVIPLGRGVAGVNSTLAPNVRLSSGSGAEQNMGQGEASYYGEALAGNPTASGEPFNPNNLTAAHRSLPLGTKLRVTNVRTGDDVVVRVNDRGPYVGNRVIDLSKAAAREVGILNSGTGRVQLALLS